MTTNEATQKKSYKWIWIGLGAAALFCLCAVGVAAFMFMRVGQQVKQGMKTDPKEAAAAAHAIVDYDLPEGYRENFAMNFMVYSMVMIAPETMGTGTPTTEPVIMLAQFKAVGNQQQMEEQIRRSFEQQSGRRGLKMEIVDVQKKTIRGKEVEVFIYEGTDENGNTMRQLVTTFPGKDGTAMVMIMGTPEDWDADKINTFIESIR